MIAIVSLLLILLIVLFIVPFGLAVLLANLETGISIKNILKSLFTK